MAQFVIAGSQYMCLAIPATPNINLVIQCHVIHTPSPIGVSSSREYQTIIKSLDWSGFHPVQPYAM